MLQREHGDRVTRRGRLRLSRYVLFTPVGRRTYVTNLLSRAVLELDTAAARWLASLRDGVEAKDLSALDDDQVDGLVRESILVPDGLDELAHVRALHETARNSDDVMTLVVAPTMACNMGCHYCYQSHAPTRLIEPAAAHLEDLLRARLPGRQRLHVQWFGGEPLLELERIRALTDRFRRVAKVVDAAYSAEIITNGFFLDHAVAAALVALDVVEVQVTFEGDRSFHDKVRFDRDTGSSFERLLANVGTAGDRLVVTARVHVAPYNVGSVHALIDELAAAGLATRLARLYFAPLFDYKSAKPSQAFQSDPRRFLSSEAFAAAQTELLEHAVRRGFAIGDLLNASFGLCMAMQRASLVVNPDGSLSKCYLDLGSLRDAIGRLGDDPAAIVAGAARWDGYDFADDEECRECQFVPVCLGGCPKQEMADADKAVICTPLRYNFHERLRLQFAPRSSSKKLASIA